MEHSHLFATMANDIQAALALSDERRKELRSPHKNSVRSLHSSWMALGQEGRDEADLQEWREDIALMLILTMTDGKCFDVSNPTQRTSCS